MRIITLITKRSIREPSESRRQASFFSKNDFSVGSFIEIIDGNKKSPAYVYKSEDAMKYKQAIRSGELDLKKIRLSKTGPNKEGHVLAKCDEVLFRKYLQDHSLAQQNKDPFIKNFFPKKRRRKAQKRPVRKKVSSFSEMSAEQYFGGTKVHHSEMHELVDTIRNYFSEDARYGIGSFSYYLGFFKKIPNQMLHQMFAEAKQSRKPLEAQKKIFWWKVGQYIKSKSNS